MRLAYRVEDNIHVLSNQHITLKICAGKLIHFRHYNNFVDIDDLSCKIASKCYVIWLSATITVYGSWILFVV